MAQARTPSSSDPVADGGRTRLWESACYTNSDQSGRARLSRGRRARRDIALDHDLHADQEGVGRREGLDEDADGGAANRRRALPPHPGLALHPARRRAKIAAGDASSPRPACWRCSTRRPWIRFRQAVRRAEREYFQLVSRGASQVACAGDEAGEVGLPGPPDRGAGRQRRWCPNVAMPPAPAVAAG